MGYYEETFVDGATGANNPVYQVWNEAQSLCDGQSLDSHLELLVSIGTGVPSLQKFDDSLKGITETLAKISTATVQQANNFHRAHPSLHTEHRYFRFDVAHGLEDIGLEDAGQRSTIMTATNRYIESPETAISLRVCSDVLAGRSLRSQRESTLVSA